jgi:hypothetical protein
MFKAYDGSRSPPSQYSRLPRDHDIKEYLSEQQLRAYSKRYSKRDDPADLFNEKSPFATSSQRKPSLRGSVTTTNKNNDPAATS